MKERGHSGDRVREQCEWIGPLVSSMEREECFFFSFSFPHHQVLLGVDDPVSAQHVVAEPFAVLLGVWVPTRAVFSGVTSHGEWDHLEKTQHHGYAMAAFHFCRVRRVQGGGAM